MLWKSAIMLLCALWAYADVFPELPPPITPGPILPNDTTTAAPTTTSVKPNTTTPAPITTTTTKSTTITTPATTTTPAPTPTTIPTKPTPPTTKPTPTPPTTKPTPTPSPTPTPKPDDKPSVNDYIANFTGTKDVCFMAKMAIQVEINRTNSTPIVLNVPKTVTYNTDCSKPDYESLAISWGSNQTASFTFYKNDSKYEIQSIALNLYLPEINQTIAVLHNKSEFSVSEKLSYLCSKDQALNLTTESDKNSTVGKIHLSHLQYQAFMNTSDARYASVWNCDGANTSDVVPVVVGCVLAILVVLALVGYLFGRRRCQARGYLSMFAQERNESDYIPMKTLSCFK